MNVTSRELACAQYKLPIILEVSHTAKAITNLTTIGFSLTNSIISSTILQEIKRKQQQAFNVCTCICLLSEAYK